MHKDTYVEPSLFLQPHLFHMFQKRNHTPSTNQGKELLWIWIIHLTFTPALKIALKRNADLSSLEVEWWLWSSTVPERHHQVKGLSWFYETKLSCDLRDRDGCECKNQWDIVILIFTQVFLFFFFNRTPDRLHLCCLCACVCVCARARVFVRARVCLWVCVIQQLELTHSLTEQIDMYISAWCVAGTASTGSQGGTSERELTARSRNQTAMHIVLVVGALRSKHSSSSPNRKQAKWGEWGLRWDRHGQWRASGEMRANFASHSWSVNASGRPADVMKWQWRNTGHRWPRKYRKTDESK